MRETEREAHASYLHGSMWQKNLHRQTMINDPESTALSWRTAVDQGTFVFCASIFTCLIKQHSLILHCAVLVFAKVYTAEIAPIIYGNRCNHLMSYP